MIIDNFDVIADNFIFDDKSFYTIHILKRVKDNPLQEKHVILIDFMCIYSRDDLYKKKERIMDKCKYFRARAYISVSRKDEEKIGLGVIKLTTEYMINKQYKAVRKVYEKVCGNPEYSVEKKWLIDVDYNSDNSNENGLIIQEYLKKNDIKHLIINTLNGYHIITDPFDKIKYQKELDISDIEIKVNNPTLLYLDIN